MSGDEDKDKGFLKTVLNFAKEKGVDSLPQRYLEDFKGYVTHHMKSSSHYSLNEEDQNLFKELCDKAEVDVSKLFNEISIVQSFEDNKLIR